MNAEVEKSASGLDTFKLGLSLLVLVSGITGFYYFGEAPLLLRVPALLLVIAIAVWIALMTQPGKGVWIFALESRTEIRKVVWPSRRETMQTTLVVFLMVFLLGLFLWLVDMLLAALLRAITG